MLAELLTEKNKEGYLDYFGQEEGKFRNTRLIFGLLFSLIAILFAYIVGNPFVYLGVIIAFYLGYKYPYFNYITKKNKNDLIISYIFPEFLQVFMAMIPTSGNVYQTLKNTIPYVKEPVRGELEKLVRNIEKGNDRKHYMEFADFIGSSESLMIMDMIYQFSEFGVKEKSLEELQRYIKNIQENKVDELIGKKMLSMENWGLTPILISLFLVGGFAGVLFWHYFVGTLGKLDGVL